MAASLFSLADWVSGKTIRNLKAQTSGVHFTLNDFAKPVTGVVCDKSEFFMPLEEGKNYDARFAMLLAAYVSQIEIDVSYYECLGPQIKVGSVQY